MLTENIPLTAKPENHSQGRELNLLHRISKILGYDLTIENDRLHAATAAIREDLKNQKTINRAKTILMKKRRIDEPTAHRFLQKESMNRRKPLREIAEAIILSEELKNKPSSTLK